MPTSDWGVGLDDVGSILRARTTDTNGVEVGTFTAATRPNDTQAYLILTSAVSEVAAEVGADLSERLWPVARRIAALGAALEIELSFFPEQVASGRSPYAELKTLYDERLARLVLSVSESTGDPDGVVGGAGSPSYGFPANAGGMVGWGSEF